MKKAKIYHVSYRCIGEQSIYVLASSKKEAIQKALLGDGDPIDFNVINSLDSTAKAVETFGKEK